MAIDLGPDGLTLGSTTINDWDDVGGGLFASYAVLHDEKSSGTVGGTFSAGSYVTRTLNTEHFDPDGIVSLSSNRFTLQAGTYFVRWSAPALRVEMHRSRLYNHTDSSIVGEGTSAYSATPDTATTRSFGTARFTIASAKAFEIRHRCTTSRSDYGLGLQASFGVSEIYTTVEIFKES